MSRYRPYDEYEPNEPRSASFSGRPLAPAKPLVVNQNHDEALPNVPETSAAAGWEDVDWEHAPQPEHAYNQPTWDEEAYLPNEADLPVMHQQAERLGSLTYDTAQGNPYSKATWDETVYEPENEDVHGYAADAPPVARADQQPAAPLDNQRAQAEAWRRANPYARPLVDGVTDLSTRFAPPLKFELPQADMDYPDPVQGMDGPVPKAKSNIYQTRKSQQENNQNIAFDPRTRPEAYRVEAEGYSPARAKRHRRTARRITIAFVIVAALLVAAYLGRGWIMEQLKPLLGDEAVQSVNQAINQATGSDKPEVLGYDASPALQIGDQAKKGISAVAGNVALDLVSVTGSNVIAREALENGRFDYYLFAAKDGMLLGYYEDLAEDGFIVCANDIYYVAESPYLINEQGLPLIDASRYQLSVGADAHLGPMINGWALISNAQGTTYNYINAEGGFLSTLWFAKAYPFTASSTLAYVDTGNVTDPEDRYSLYELSASGNMKMWKHSSHMDDVLGCAAGVAVLQTGEMILLNGQQTSLGIADDISIYADCGALIARDPDTGKYGLFVNGDQYYDYAYDSIMPVAKDVQWAQYANGIYKQFTVTGMAYPLPLSHYFALQKGEAQELVALSTSSVYPLLLNDER